MNIDVSEFRLKIYPKDFNLTKSFYEDTLGFELEYSWDREGSKGAMFRVGDTILELLYPCESEINDYRSGISLMVDDVWSVSAYLKSAKIKVKRGLRDNPWGDTSFAIYDPDGFSVTFFTKTKEYRD